MSAELLKALGSTGDVLVTLDFETYWDKDYKLRKMTTESYVRDPRFEVIGVGVRFGDRPAVWLEERQFRYWASRVDWSRVALCCHHAQFDAFILSHHYGIRPRFLLCTMSMARGLSVPGGVSLNNISEHFGLGKKGEEVRKTAGKRRGDFTRADWLAFGEYCINDVDLTHAALFRMLPLFPALELWTVDRTVRAFTEPVFEGDQKILEDTYAEEKRRKSEVLRAVAKLARVQGEEAAREALASSDKFCAVLQALGVTAPTKPGKRGLIPAFAQNDPGMKTLLEHSDPRVREVCKARLDVKSTIVETRTQRIIGIAKRGKIPFYLRYCGAHTHRFSGGDKMNPQNFNRGGALRDAIMAPAGHLLAVADSGQIEARGTAWLAGAQDVLATFRRNDATEDGDFYSDEGSRYFRKPVSKAKTPGIRQVAKCMCLGLGFKMGWVKFAGELLKGMLGTPPVQFGHAEAEEFGVNAVEFGAQPWGQGMCGDAVQDMIDTYGVRVPFDQLLIHCAVADYFVRLYRKSNPKIVNLWATMDRVLGVMARPGSADEVRLTFKGHRVIRNGIIKPSGLVLQYPQLTRKKDGWWYLGAENGRPKWKRLHGGVLTENVVQSDARDVLVEQKLWISTRYHVGTTTHDEVVAVPPEAEAEECLAFMFARMRIPPAWCADIPLNVEGGIARSYGAAK